MGGINSDPYNAGNSIAYNSGTAYQENNQGQGSIGSSGSGIRGNAIGGVGSRGSDFKLPQVSNKMAMGGLKGLPGMPSSKGRQNPS